MFDFNSIPFAIHQHTRRNKCCPSLFFFINALHGLVYSLSLSRSISQRATYKYHIGIMIESYRKGGDTTSACVWSSKKINIYLSPPTFPCRRHRPCSISPPYSCTTNAAISGLLVTTALNWPLKSCRICLTKSKIKPRTSAK